MKRMTRKTSVTHDLDKLAEEASNTPLPEPKKEAPGTNSIEPALATLQQSLQTRPTSASTAEIEVELASLARRPRTESNMSSSSIDYTSLHSPATTVSPGSSRKSPESYGMFVIEVDGERYTPGYDSDDSDNSAYADTENSDSETNNAVNNIIRRRDDGSNPRYNPILSLRDATNNASASEAEHCGFYIGKPPV